MFKKTLLALALTSVNSSTSTATNIYDYLGKTKARKEKKRLRELVRRQKRLDKLTQE